MILKRIVLTLNLPIIYLQYCARFDFNLKNKAVEITLTVFERFLATDNFALSLKGCYDYSKFSTRTMKIPKGWYHFTPQGFK